MLNTYVEIGKLILQSAGVALFVAIIMAVLFGAEAWMYTP